MRQNETFLVMYFVILLVLSTKLGDIYPKVPALSLKLKATHTDVDLKTPTFIIYTSPRSVSASLHVSMRQLSPPPTKATVNVSESPPKKLKYYLEAVPSVESMLLFSY